MNPNLYNINDMLIGSVGIWRIVGAILVLVIGLTAAKTTGRTVARALSQTSLNERGKQYFHDQASLSGLIGSVVKYFLMFVTLLIVLELLRFSSILNPFVGFVGQITVYIPHVLAALLLAAVAHIVGTVAKRALVRLLGLQSVKGRLSFIAPYREVLGNIAYALIILLFLPGILQSLHIEAVSAPVGAIVALLLGYVPKLAAAAILVILGHLLAKFVSRLTAQLTAAFRLERWTGPEVNAASLLGSIAYFLIIFPIAVQALNVLQIESIRSPAQHILNLIIAWIPRIAVAAFLLYLGYLLAKIARNLALTVLSPLKLDDKLNGMLPGAALPRAEIVLPGETDESRGASSVSEKIGPHRPVTRWIANVMAVLVFGFFLVEATNLLDLAFIATTVTWLLVLLPKLILAAVIIVAGLILARFVSRQIKEEHPAKSFVQPIIIVLAVVIALTEIGLASVIVTSGFLIVLGALAIAFIISVGMGSIPAVKRYWEEKQRKI